MKLTNSPTARALRAAAWLALALASAQLQAAYTAPSQLEITNAIRQVLAAEPQKRKRKAADFDAQALYAARNYAPVWTGSADASERLATLRARLGQADADGLNPRHYQIGAATDVQPGAEQLAIADIRATRGFLRFLLDLHGSGKKAASLRYPSARDSVLTDLGAELQRAQQATDLAAHLATLGPQHRLYKGLREALAHYRGLARAGGWQRLPPGPTLKPGVKHPHVADLRERLFASGDLIDASLEDTVYDAPLTAAVEAFQTRHGLEADGQVGPKTRQALNVDVETRIRQIVVNLERARWLPAELGDTYVMVNVPAFRLEAYEHGQLALDMAVIVGRRHRATPMYSGELEWMEFNPYWGVPDSIARKDILPKLQEDPNYLQGLRIYMKGHSYPYVELDRYAVDWGSVSPEEPFPFYFRQDPGPGNALGQVKFLFRNPHNVYLHDTPKQYLFSRTRRAFSSGCIRLERPLDMAEFMLRGEPMLWDRTRIDEALADGSNQRVTLARKVAVHLVYHTVWLGRDQRVHFAPDLYRLDRALEAFVDSERFRPELDTSQQAAADNATVHEI